MRGLSVVVPAYNEEANIKKCLNGLHAVLKKTDWDWEIIVVDDGSRDETGDIAKEMIKKIPHLKVVENKPNKGYGGSLKAGFAVAKKEFVAFVPADNQFDFADIHKLVIKQEATNADIVTGIRPAGGKDNFYRLAVRWFANSLVRALLGYLATDVDCGLKLFKRSILEKVTLPSNGALIDTQLFAGARARGMKIGEVEVKHLPRMAGKSTGGNPKVLFKALLELITFWWHLKQEIMVEQGRAVFRWEAIFILLILVVAAFVRLYKIDQYMTFLGDEGRDALVVREMLTGRNFPLIGPGTSIGNMYLGPLYYYLMAIPLLAFNYSPVGPAVMVAGFGILTVGLLWWVGRQWFGRIPALVTAILYAMAPTVIIYSRSSWNPNIMPFFALLAMYGAWKVWKFGYWRWLIIVAVCLAFVLNSHYLGLLLFPIVGLTILLAPKKPGWIKQLVVAAGIFVVLMSPLLIFDLNPAHPGQNFSSIKKFFTERQTTVSIKPYNAIPQLWPLSVQITGSLMASKAVWLASIIVVALLIGFVLRIKKRGINKDLGLVVMWVLVGLVGLGLYKQHIYDHYFGFLYPAMFLLLGFVVETLKRWSIPVVLAIGIAAVVASPLRYAPNNQLRHTQEVAQFISQKAGGQPFNLALLAKQNYDRSYVYFLDLSQAPYYTIHQKLAQQLFVICEYSDCQPIGNPLWEVAAFGWAKIDQQWEFPWGVKLFKLVPNPSGKS